MQSDKRALKVFMAEDNAGDVVLIREAMAAYGLTMELRGSEDGEEAVLQLSRLQHDDLPELILIDLNLPRIGGMDVLRHVRSLPQLSNIPVIVLTSSQAKADRAEAEALGASFVTKPPTLNDFVSVVGGAIHRLMRRRDEAVSRLQMGILVVLTCAVWIRRVALALKIR